MCASILRLPLLKKAGRTPKPVRVTRSVERVGRQAMIQRRDHCMAEIAMLRSNVNACGSLADKARQLLTRHWSVASWRTRADILRTAEWLIGIGRKGAASGSPGMSDTGQFHHARDRSWKARKEIGEPFQ